MNLERILLIEDHPLVAQAMQSLLGTLGFHQVVTCGHAGEAIDRFRTDKEWFRIFLDLGVPGAVGLSLVHEMSRHGLKHCGAVISASDNPQWIDQVRALGLLGYILKTASVEDFNLALQLILQGRTYFAASNLHQPTRLLTRRQGEILQLLSIGLSTKDIARRLKLSPGTVDNHVCALIHALEAKDRTHAVAMGMRLGYISGQEA
jgi:DNA-binding NarL/FixJ family response regulator